MQDFRIILIPEKREDLVYEFDTSCKDIPAAKDYATFHLAMHSGKYKEAHVLSQWKGENSWRQAIDPIVYNFNL